MIDRLFSFPGIHIQAFTRRGSLFFGASFATMASFNNWVAMKIVATYLLCIALLSSTNGQDSQPVVLLFAGDLVLSDHVENFIGDDLSYVFSNWSDVGPFDVFMLNLEHPVTTSDRKVEKKFNFKMHPRYMPILQHANVSLVNLANNHIADYGREGLEDTMHNLDSIGVRYVGVGKNINEARTPVVIEKKGKRIAFLGYYGGGEYAATDTRSGFAPRRASIIVEDVRKVRQQADYVVVNFHWGVERAEHPEPEQIALARRVVDAGADLIIGHHPHVLQGVELYKGKTIAYSLGNFVFGGNSLHTYETAILRVELTDSEPVITLVPIRIERWKAKVADGDSKQRVLRLVQERSKIFQTDNIPSKGALE